MDIAKQMCWLGEGNVSIEPDGDALLDRLVKIHGIEPARTYWWESLKTARSFSYDRSCDSWRKQVFALLAEMGNPVFLAITDDDDPSPLIARFLAAAKGGATRSMSASALG